MTCFLIAQGLNNQSLDATHTFTLLLYNKRACYINITWGNSRYFALGWGGSTWQWARFLALWSGTQWSGRFLGITGWAPIVCKSNRLHVDILRFSFIISGICSTYSWSVNFLQFRTSTSYFSNSTGSFVTNYRFSPIIGGTSKASQK